eukprot:SAG22_NODE_8366_length_661_cov_1.158363_1_plen_47_part_10
MMHCCGRRCHADLSGAHDLFVAYVSANLNRIAGRVITVRGVSWQARL